VKDFGYSKLSKFMRDVDGVVVSEDPAGARIYPDCD